MFGGVPAPRPHPPAPPARLDHVAVHDTRIPQRQQVHAVGEVERPLGGPLGQHLPGHPGGPPEGQRLGQRHRLLVERQHPRGQPGRARRRQRRTAGLKPADKPHVIGVVMRQPDPRDRLAGKGPVQQRAPKLPAECRVEPGVDDGPPVVILQREDVDVVQRHRQRQAQPQHTLGDLGRLAATGDGQLGQPERPAHAAKLSAVIAPRSPARTCDRSETYSGSRRLM